MRLQSAPKLVRPRVSRAVAPVRYCNCADRPVLAKSEAGLRRKETDVTRATSLTLGWLLGAFLVMPAPAAAEAVQPPVHRCDRLAGDPRDPGRAAPGIRVPDMDGQQALEACQSALEAYPDSVRFLYQMGRANHALNNYDDAARWFRKAADAGYAPAMSILGVFYAAGGGVPQDYDQAVLWYRKAAERGYPVAMYNLGVRYADGLGVGGRDYGKAAQWFERAADNGHVGAMEGLAYLYLAGRGVPRDDVQAAHWFRRAAENGRPDAMYHLGYAYDTGRGVTADGKQAARWLARALKAGSRDLMNDLANHDALWTDATRRALQDRLRQAGVYGGPVDGSFSDAFRQAMKDFAAKP